MLVDTHCHLDGDRFDDDRGDVIARARGVGVKAMVNVGCDLPSSRRSVDLARTHSDIWATVGVHPHEAKLYSPSVTPLRDLLDDKTWEGELLQLAQHPKTVGIGECGLDYHYDHSPRDVQRQVFARQIAIARQAKKPLVLHIRNGERDAPAFLESLDILEQEGARDVGGVFHCFTGSVDEARRGLDLGFTVSLPGVVTFKNNGQLTDVARLLPSDRVVVETDAPYMAPVPMRGKRNEPAFVAHTAAFVAGVRGIDVAEFIRITGENAARLFGLHA